ncbi:MAG TPA: FAD-dependent oxidoreductase, partial [Allocoleopsis sp.]
VHRCDKVTEINRAEKTITSAKGLQINYDKIVLATGSYPFVPPIKGKDTQGTFVYRTIEDLEAMDAYSKNCKTGVVIGGGLLGLEAANALQNLGLTTHVVEFAPRLMPVQIDDGGGNVLRNKIEELNITVHLNKSTTEIVSENGKVTKMLFADGTELATDMIVFSAGIRPRDELAKNCGLTLGERGGILINEKCETSDPNIYAIGECAQYQGRIYGLVAPGYTMAGVAADILSETNLNSQFTGADMSTKLKLLGVDVASFGDNFAKTPGAKEMVFTDPIKGVYKKLVINNDGSQLLGGILVGDASSYGNLLQLVQNNITLPPHPEDLLLPPREGASNT